MLTSIPRLLQVHRSLACEWESCWVRVSRLWWLGGVSTRGVTPPSRWLLTVGFGPLVCVCVRACLPTPRISARRAHTFGHPRLLRGRATQVGGAYPFLSGFVQGTNLRQTLFSSRTFAVVSTDLIFFWRRGPRIDERGWVLVIIAQDRCGVNVRHLPSPFPPFVELFCVIHTMQQAPSHVYLGVSYCCVVLAVLANNPS